MNIPIAMLHHVSNAPDPSLKDWTIDHLKFLEILDEIERSKLETTTFEEIIHSSSSQPLKNKVIISFDDCPATLFDFAIPELVKRNMKAVFYVPTAFIGGTNVWDVEEHGTAEVSLLNEQQILQLSHLGMEIGSHGEQHVKLNQIPSKAAFLDVSNSKLTLEQLLKKPIYSFAYPYGEIPDGFKAMLLQAGYHFAVSIYTSFECKYSLRRFGISQTDDVANIRLKLSKRYGVMRKLYDSIFLLKNRLLKRN